ncbi:hypothetical protein JX266_003852 [Neoarthrinium moseri]|nr:hypothetical protein JX266_003852 [Neoarthrinium moseri]
MAYIPYHYPDPTSSPWQMGNTVMDSVNNQIVDPELESQHALRCLSPWNPLQMPRPSTPHAQGTLSYIQHPSPEAVFTAGSIKILDGIATIPSATFRQNSPSDNLSSTCSSALSPLGGSDYGVDNTPSTPQDDTLVPQLGAHCDTWGSNEHQAWQLSGIVKPEEVNFYQEPSQSFEDEKSTDFLPPGFSMFNDSNYEINAYYQSSQNQLPRQMSPVESSQRIKDEICVSVVDQVETYPQAPLESDDDGFYEKNFQTGDCDNDNDGDYKPKGTRKRAGSSTSRQPKGRKRPSQTQSSTQRKKTKAEDSPVTKQQSIPKLPGKGSFPCEQCPDIHFKDECGLQKHIKQQHTRPFVCTFSFAGCDSTFASKNEWKRHVASQHLLLHYWLCQQDACAKLSNSPDSPTKATGASRRSGPYSLPVTCTHSLPNGAIFNRKDLYTQHLRRMHIPPVIKKQVKQRKTVPEWEERIRSLQEQAHKLRCKLPDYMECPAVGCQFVFNGPMAWDERMEHVAKHLEKAANGTEDPIVFGGDSDPTLTTWACRPDVAVIVGDGVGNWRLNNPLKPEKNSKAQASNYSEEDAPGEEVDD